MEFFIVWIGYGFESRRLLLVLFVAACGCFVPLYRVYSNRLPKMIAQEDF